MSTLYRSPSHLVDGHEWYVAVESSTEAHRPTTRNRVASIMRWRPHGQRRTRWSPISKWKGPLPKGFRKLFEPYLKQAAIARTPLEQRRSLP